MDSGYVDADADGRLRGVILRMRTRTFDLACLSFTLACAAVVAWLAAQPFIGHLPDQNAFYSADTGRVYAYLSGNTEGYYRMKVHPLYGWLCILYQFFVIKVLHVPPSAGIPVLSAAISVTCCGLLYAVMRRLQVAALMAASFVLLFCSSATYVFWSTLPETHMLAGASVLISVLLMTSPDPGGWFKSAVAVAAGFSIVVTDGMVWVLRQFDYAPLRCGNVREFLVRARSRIKSLIRPALMGVALVYLAWTPEWPILGKRVGIPFNFLEERHFVDAEPGSVWRSMNVFGLTPPHIAFDWLVPLLCIAATVASLWVLRPRLWFIPLFALFGLALHTVYSSESAFLFSPDYMPMFIVTLALVAKEKLPASSPGIIIPFAAILLIANLAQWHDQMQAIDAAGQLKTFATVTLH